jgi:hypothetical protein
LRSVDPVGQRQQRKNNNAAPNTRGVSLCARRTVARVVVANRRDRETDNKNSNRNRQRPPAMRGREPTTAAYIQGGVEYI